MTDTGYAPDRWEFDGEVTRVFDNMLARSIPNFEAMRDLTSTIAARHLQPGTTVVDLGTSRGGALAALHPEAQPTVTFVGAEISLPMVEAARERFDGLANVGIAELDLRLPEHRKVLLPPSSCSVGLASPCTEA